MSSTVNQNRVGGVTVFFWKFTSSRCPEIVTEWARQIEKIKKNKKAN